MKKKLLAILLAAIMVMTMIPTVAFAEEITCPKCNGVGTLSHECEACEGEGAFSCDTCSSNGGNGEIRCPNCEGAPASASTNFEMCPECQGDTGHTECASCKGYGRICKTCNNTGNVECPDCDGGEITCTACEGNRTITTPCPLCGGTKKVNASKITGTITAADFAYELIIPADTTLTEDNHKDVLLGSGDNAGLVTIEVTKHSCATIDVYYTVDLTNGNLTDGNSHTITTTYGISNSATGTFAALAANTEYTVYTGGEEVETYIKVSADETSWNAAPVGDYNATLVFNFDQAPAAAVTIGDILPSWLSVSDADDFETNVYWDGKNMSATVFVEGCEYISGHTEYTDFAGLLTVGSTVPLFGLSLDTPLTKIANGYQCTVTGVSVSGFGSCDVTATFTMDGNKLTEMKFDISKNGTPQGGSIVLSPFES